MLVVETIGRIRREHLSKGKSIREIARDLKISRNTVRKIIRSDETALSYERQIQPRPKLGRWKADIDRMLAKNADAPTRERLTLIRLFEELRALATKAATTPSDATPRAGAANTRALRRPPTFRCRLHRAKPTSSTGATRLWWWTAPR